MVNFRSSRQAGLTMIEVIISAIILTAIVGMASWLVWSATTHMTTSEVTLQLEMSTRELLSTMSKELHQSRLMGGADSKVEMLDTNQLIPSDGPAIDITGATVGSHPTPGVACSPKFQRYMPTDPKADAPVTDLYMKYDGIRFRTPGKQLDLTAVDSSGNVLGKVPPKPLSQRANADLNGVATDPETGKTYDNFNLVDFKTNMISKARMWVYEVQYWWEIDNTGLKPEGDRDPAGKKLGPNDPSSCWPDGIDNNGDGVIDEGVIKKMETWYSTGNVVERRTVSTILRNVTDFKVWVPANPAWVVLKAPGLDPKDNASYVVDPSVTAEPNQYKVGEEQSVVITITVSKADPRHPKLANRNIVRTYTTTVDVRN